MTAMPHASHTADRITALEAQLDAVREATELHETTTRLTQRGEAFVYRIRSLLASAPSDALARVKREAAAEALEDLAATNATMYSAATIRARAAEIRGSELAPNGTGS